ncbi:DUF3152 domain-containing protein [Lentzea sp. NPDC054927]
MADRGSVALMGLTGYVVHDVAAEQPSPAGAPAGPPPKRAVNPEGDARFPDSMKTAELPQGGPFTERGNGRWTIVPGGGDRVGPNVAPLTYTIEIEGGVEVPGGAEGFDRMVRGVLAHPKSWIGSGQHAFQRVADGNADVRVSLTSQMTTRQLCGFEIPYEGSCWRPDLKRVVINTARWERGAVVFQGSIVAYQQYVINHEVGHALEFDHQGCQTDGELAPVMMQQTWGTSNNYLASIGADRVTADGKECVPNPWPFPRRP